MCLGVPGKIVAIDEAHPLGLTMGKVNFNGISKDVCLAYVLPEAKVGDWVMVHAGFALNTLDEQEAAEVFNLLSQLGEVEGFESN